MADTKTTGGGMGLLGWTFIVFLVLKLTDKIDWSWWWVTAPLWGPLVVFAFFLIVAGIFLGLARLLESQEEKNVRKAKSALGNYSRSLRP